MQNKDGKFVKASPESVSKAGAGAVGSMNGHILAANIWNQPGDEAYPVASFTYMIVYRDLGNLPDKASAQALVDFLWWATHDGQQYAPELDYAPLAAEVQAKVEAALRTITYKGEMLSIGRRTPRSQSIRFVLTFLACPDRGPRAGLSVPFSSEDASCQNRRRPS